MGGIRGEGGEKAGKRRKRGIEKGKGRGGGRVVVLH